MRISAPYSFDRARVFSELPGGEDAFTGFGGQSIALKTCLGAYRVPEIIAEPSVYLLAARKEG